ncbi:hypothetical protein PIB30_050902 [Stylosanthes scabra]|uniref:F-box domain-containing protein n=1 Tax=Stylosanthes scabra TaxID=79078 RepID=A0ABU6XG95_9FABA|nr:hypothetical protein [Stylosanthes scabra]
MANDNTEPNMKRARESDTDYDCDYDDDYDDDDDSDIDMEGLEDRLSDLPDCILIHIMSFLTTKDVVCTSILSRRWKDLWKHVPSLVLRITDLKFLQMTRFNDAVSKFPLLRDGSVPLLNVDLHYLSSMRPDIQKSISEYAVMHNVERLKLHADRFLHLSPSVFSSQTLTSLHLSSRCRGFDLLPKTLNMGALTSLHLKNFVFCAPDNESLDPFSCCVKLKTLVLDNCSITNSKILFISNAKLVNLTIHSRKHTFGKEIVLSTPGLRSLSFSGVTAWQLSARNNLSFLKEVTIDFGRYVNFLDSARHEAAMTVCLQSASILINWLQVFANITSLTICSGTLKVLSLTPELLNTGSPGLDNLQLLIVKLKDRSALSRKRHRATDFKTTLVHTAVVDYLIRNSPFAEVK